MHNCERRRAFRRLHVIKLERHALAAESVWQYLGTLAPVTAEELLGTLPQGGLLMKPAKMIFAESLLDESFRAPCNAERAVVPGSLTGAAATVWQHTC